MKRIKNIVSYLYPIVIEARNGKVTNYLEVVKSKGQYLSKEIELSITFISL